MKLRHGLAAGAGICTAVALAMTMESGEPARAVGPPADGNYSYNEAGVSGVTWQITALCDQPSGTRNMNDYSDPIVFSMNCALNVASFTDERTTPADKLQNFVGRARTVSMLWTFKAEKPDGVSCPGGGTAPSTDTYSFSDETMTGTHTSMHGAVCGLQPGMTKTPFSLHLVGPPPSPIQRYPLYCNGIAMCY